MPTYDIAVSGAVQDVGFRDLVETLGRTHGLRGFVYNESGGTVRIVARGPADDVADFLEGVRESSERADIPIGEIDSEETDEPKPLPATFFKAPTDEWSDIGRKLDEGIQVLRDIKEDTAVITDIKEDTAVISDIKEDTAVISDIKEDTAVISDIKEDTAVISDIKEDTAVISDIKKDTAVISDIKEDTAAIKDDTAAIRDDTS